MRLMCFGDVFMQMMWYGITLFICINDDNTK